MLLTGTAIMQLTAFAENCEALDVLTGTSWSQHYMVLLYIPRAKLPALGVQEHRPQQSCGTTQPLANTRAEASQEYHHKHIITRPHCRYCNVHACSITSVCRCRPQLVSSQGRSLTWRRESSRTKLALSTTRASAGHGSIKTTFRSWA